MRTITAMYDSRSDAEEARTELASLGISADNVTILDQQSMQSGSTTTGSTSDYSTTGTTASGQTSGGLWESFKSLFTDDHDTYAEGMRRGGYLLTAKVDESQVDQAIDVLDDDGTVDLDQRSESWRSEGWTGGSAAMARPDTGRTDATSRGTTGEQVIPIVEEQLQVGKREVSRGGVRVRSYIVETPVHEEVRLREEHVNVERRPASGTMTGNAADLLQERTIEVSETSEEAVISKTAQVREELVVGKTVEERVQNVDDTVRRTEVDVDRMDGDSTLTGRGTGTGMTGRDYDAGSTADRTGGSLGDKVAGLAKEAVGNTKQGIGSLTGSESLRQDGVAQEQRGEAQQDGTKRSGY